MDSYSQISICEGFFSVPWFDFWKIVEADLTLSETLVPFAEITFFPDTIFDFYRGGSDPVRDACTLRKNHLFSGHRTPDTGHRTNIWIPRLPDGNKRFAQLCSEGATYGSGGASIVHGGWPGGPTNPVPTDHGLKLMGFLTDFIFGLWRSSQSQNRLWKSIILTDFPF